MGNTVINNCCMSREKNLDYQLLGRDLLTKIPDLSVYTRNINLNG